MKKLNAKYKKRRLAALVVAVFAFAGLGLLGYSLFPGGSPASAESPERVHGRISEDLEKKFQRSIPERIVETIRGPRAKTPESKRLELSVPALDRVDGVPVYDAPESGYDQALHDGVVHVRGTGFPWQDVANVYIAGHRVGYPGTKSNLVFWDLNELEKGDEIFLTDADGKRYTYEVFAKRVISPDTTSILRPTKGKNIISLQTCTLPDYSRRLIVQGELNGEK
ncbi:MAG: sortase [Rubrobacteraceae bacterium]|jgi:sortase A|nr:sortase [Rubrobacteraceae bacterium]MBA3616954.1 sortase [Rubrobacteraceae bacterium]